MDYLSTGNEIVDAVGKISFTGNITPPIWYRTIKKKGHPNFLAIAILSDIVYWYRPSEVRDEKTGMIIGWKKRFRSDLLQRSYADYAEMFGQSKKSITAAIVALESMGVIDRVFRTVHLSNGIVANNVLYIRLHVDALYNLTYPATDLMEEDTPVEKLGERVWTNLDRPVTTTREEVWKVSAPPIDKNGETNTETTTKIITETINQSEAYKEIIKENLDYDHFLSYADEADRRKMEEIYQLICDVVCYPKAFVRIGGAEYPYEIVKSRFLKIKQFHAEYVMQALNDTTTQITNIRAYLLTALYRAPETMHYYYQQAVQHNEYNSV